MEDMQFKTGHRYTFKAYGYYHDWIVLHIQGNTLVCWDIRNQRIGWDTTESLKVGMTEYLEEHPPIFLTDEELMRIYLKLSIRELSLPLFKDAAEHSPFFPDEIKLAARLQNL